jgi:hypothetical protein
LIWRIGGWVEKNEILPKNLQADIRSWDWTYSLKYHSERTAPSPDVRSKMWQRTLFSPVVPYIVLVSLFYSYFSKNRINDRSFFNIRGYGALIELHGGALRLGWIQTHMDALLSLFLYWISILYISNMYILQLSWNTF